MNQPKFNVLDINYIPAGKTLDGKQQFNVSWIKLGTASSMQDAKRKYGGNPVLEEGWNL